jgi:YhcH/YjgK/YiaL family protein
LFLLAACSNVANKNHKMNQEINLIGWIEDGDWNKDLRITPDSSINKSKLFSQFQKNDKLWEAAFKHLQTVDFDALKVGKYELNGNNLFFFVDEYNTKNEEDTKYEAHRKYADIQYLIEGEEKIGVNKLQPSTLCTEYVDSKDIAFYEMPEDNYRVANQNVFFVFFPDDAHRPCVKTLENSKVKKIVYKVRVDQ